MADLIEGHTAHSFDGELNHIHILLLEMGGLVLDQVRNAVSAIENKDVEAAILVLQREPAVDALELKVDDETARIIAKRSPVANDLRIIIAISKAVTDLERIGDEAVRIAGIARHFYDNNKSTPRDILFQDVYTMGKNVQELLAEALQVVDTFDLEQANKLAKCDGHLDGEFQSALRRLTTYVFEDPRTVGHTIYIVLTMKALERIGDHAINLAEYIIYALKGVDIRHREPDTDAGPIRQ